LVNIEIIAEAVTLSVLSSTLGVSEPYAVDIRAGKRVPHPRHWQALAGLVGVEPQGAEVVSKAAVEIF